MVQCCMAMWRSSCTAPESRISIVRASAYGLDADTCSPEGVALAVEVCSPEAEERDCEGKRMFYISMGMPIFWLIERASWPISLS